MPSRAIKCERDCWGKPAKGGCPTTDKTHKGAALMTESASNGTSRYTQCQSDPPLTANYSEEGCVP